MLRMIETHDHGPQWLEVADVMRAETHEEANAALDSHAKRSSSITGVMPQRVIREGEKAPDLLALIEDDEDIAVLVLAAATGSEGPGPLISTFIKNAGEFPIPIVIVPGNLSDADNCAVLNWRNKKRPLTAWCGIVDSIHRRCYSSALSPPSLSRAFQARPPTRPRIARCLSRWLHRSHIVRKRIYSPDADRTHPHRTCDRPTRAYDRRW